MQCSIVKTSSSCASKRTILDSGSHRRKKRRLILHKEESTENKWCTLKLILDYSKSIKNLINIWATLLRHFVKKLPTKYTSNGVFILLLMNTCVCTFCMASPCETNHWWAPFKNACLPCTVCQGEMITIRPCQLHQDTICGTIADLRIDWVVPAKTEPNWKERRKDDQNIINLEDKFLAQEQMQEDSWLLDWVSIILFVAALACLLLFIVAAFILFYHMRQWRHIEQSLNHDVEELSNKFMAKLAEVQRIDAGAFFIRNTDSLRIPGYQAQYVLLPEKVLEPRQHQQQWYVAKSLQPGNVYIEEI